MIFITVLKVQGNGVRNQTEKKQEDIRKKYTYPTAQAEYTAATKTTIEIRPRLIATDQPGLDAEVATT